MADGNMGGGGGPGGTRPRPPQNPLEGLLSWWLGRNRGRPPAGDTGEGEHPAAEAGPSRKPRRWIRKAILTLSGLVVFLVLLSLVSRVLTDYLWYQEVGYITVFWTRIWARVALAAAAGAVFFGIFYGNLRLARRLLPRVKPVSGTGNEVFDIVTTRSKRGRRILLALSIVLGLVFAAGYSGSWERVLLYLHRSDFGYSAPVFGRDASFFVFSLPAARLALSFMLLTIILTFVGVILIYLSDRAIGMEGRRVRSAPHVKGHLSVILAIATLGKAADYMLGMWELAYSQRGTVFGPSFTDVHAQLPVLRILAIVAVIAAVLFLVNIYYRGWRLPLIAIGLLVLTWLFGGKIYPAIIQQYQVSPNEIAKESPYILNNIEATRWAFGLAELRSQPFPATTDLEAEDIKANPGTIGNVRVWDPRPALDTYAQIQEIRLYYSFQDVDVDRYTVDGRYREVILATRELDQTKLQQQAQTWVNQHLTYTHGYGVVVSPVNEATGQGLPVLFVSDIPPQGSTSLRITRPEVYYGELGNPFVLVKTTAKEFDYPKGDANVFTEYKGTGGVGIGSFPRQLIFSLRFSTLKLLVSDYLRPDSRIMYRRTIYERVQSIAPFLRYDRDPYMVVRDDGSLVWIWDAYTTTSRFPNSQPRPDGTNYIRNPIKVVVDAYNGSVTFYQIDPDDALANTWGKIYPGLFTPGSELPDDLRRHLRYPEDMFTIQAQTLATYHMKDAQVFYNKEDSWEIPTEIYGQDEVPVVPFYVMMSLPGESEAEFVLLQPFTPLAKKNMVSWMAARMDGDNYGQLLVLEFPKDKLVFGPAQVEARINNDPVISAQLTLWSQAGSQVIRGNLLVIPVEDSIIYVEPLYLQAEQSAIPELTRVIVTYGDRVIMEPDLASALEVLFPGSSSASTTTTGGTTTTTVPGGTTTTTLPSGTTTTTVPGTLPADRGELISLAEQLYEEAIIAQRAGDWTTYGQKIDRLGEVLAALQALEEGGR